MLWVLARRIKRKLRPYRSIQRIYNKVASWICPGLFLFSAVLVICFASIFLNVCLAERMQQLQDNDMKYRYLLMQDKQTGNFDMLENKFKWQRDNGFIRSLTDSVIDFEYRIQAGGSVGTCKAVERTSRATKERSR